MNTIPINLQAPEKRRNSDDGNTLEVHSIFYTVQGEGPFTGHPAVFVRLSGCNLQCPSCDTEYTNHREYMQVRTIISAILGTLPARTATKHMLVVITGGEPFRQNISPLVATLFERGFDVQVETNGTLPPSPNLSFNTTVVCSPKAGKVSPALYKYVDAYKYVLSADSMDLDGLPILALNHTASPRVARPHEGFDGPVYLQPMDTKDEGGNLRNLRAVKRSCMQNGYILQLQLHKIIGVE